MVVIKQNILSQIDLYYGDICMPKGFEIDRDILQKDLLTSQIQDCPFPFSRELDKLHCYLREHIQVEYGFNLIQQLTTGYSFKPKETNYPEKDVNELDLRNSPDYTMLYGINVNNCSVRIYYNSNRRAGRSWDMPITNNKFVIFPSSQQYFITNNQADSLNTILKTTYEYI